jgi:AraC-like DNA-binding protein
VDLVTPEEIADLAHLRRARDLIDRRFAEPLDVPAMARAALMSPAHFSRRFRATYGETPYSYLMTRRIERAKALLRQGDVGDRRLRGRGLYVARLVQFALHRDRRRDTVAVPRARPPAPRGRPAVRHHDRHAAAPNGDHRLTRCADSTEQDRRSTPPAGGRTVTA